MGEARDFKFSVPIYRQACKPKNAKVSQEGRDLLYISGMGRARDFKFSVHIGRQASKPTKCKSRSRGA